MTRITFTADEQHESIINDAKDEHGVDSTAAAVRQCIEEYAELHQTVEELESEIDELNAEIEEERQERRMVLSYVITDDVDAKQLEDVEHVEVGDDDDQPPTESSLSGRIKWLLFGE